MHQQKSFFFLIVIVQEKKIIKREEVKRISTREKRKKGQRISLISTFILFEYFVNMNQLVFFKKLIFLIKI